MSRYERTKHTNLRRLVSTGEYLLFAHISGKLIRERLGTLDEAVALYRRDKRTSEIRRALGIAAPLAAGQRTLRQVLQGWLDKRQDEVVVILTKLYHASLMKSIAKEFPTDVLDGSAKAFSIAQAAAWSKRFSSKHSASRYNHAIGMLKKAFEMAIEDGVRMDNPVSKLKRIRETPKIPTLPSVAQFHAIVASIRKSGHRASQDAADLVEFLAYGGFRQNEARHILKSDVDEAWNGGMGRIRVSVVKGLTRGSQVRYVPMNEDMRNLIQRLKVKWGGRDTVMAVSECQRSLDSACEDVKCARFTHHALRHLFATQSIQQGAEITVVSQWLGHCDKGVLAMKVYGHLREDHSAEMMNRVSFSAPADLKKEEIHPRLAWVRPDTSARYLPSGIRGLHRIVATGEFVRYHKVNGVPTRTPLSTWSLEEAQRMIAA